MLYADDTGIVARTSASLAKSMAIVEKDDAFGLTVSEKKARRFHRYNRQLELKVKLLRSEVNGALLYGCNT